MDDAELLKLAENQLDKAYAPYSGFRVGAALLCADGSVFCGCNVENSSYGAACCAERTAVFNAVSGGKRDFVKLAVVSDKNPTYPCGICRQVLSEFSQNLPIVTRGTDKPAETFSLSELLPLSFRLE